MGKTLEQLNQRDKKKAVTMRLNNLEKQTEFYLKRIQSGDAGAAESARYHLQDQVDALRYFFEQTENPVFAWRALLVCHDAGLPLPEWITTYLYNGGLEIVNGAYSDHSGQDMKDTLYNSLGFNMRGQGGAAGQFKTLLRDGAALDGLFEHEIKIDGTQEAADNAEAARLINDLISAVDRDIKIQKMKRLRYDRQRKEYRIKGGLVSAAFVRAAYLKHGAKLNIPPETVKALADRGPDESDDEKNRIIEALARHLRKSRKKISKIK